jgi:hypothetical protein
MAKRAFISHIGEEAEVAAKLKTALNRDFLQLLEIFVSSDGESISAGDEWLASIDTAIRQSALMLILCSPASIRRPWINFEAGAAWMRQITIVPLCHAGLTPKDLPAPLSFKQGILLTETRGLQRLYARIAKELDCAPPETSLQKLVAVLTATSDKVSITDRDRDLLAADRGIKHRLDEALRHKKFKWRAIQALAAAAGTSMETAADLLRADSAVRFSRAKSGNVIVGLRSRVGPGS